MVLADEVNRACLRSALPHFFVEAHLRPDLQAVEIRVDDAVSMEVDEPPARRFDPAITLVRVELRDLSVAWNLVGLQMAPAHARVVFELPANGVERIANGDIHSAQEAQEKNEE